MSKNNEKESGELSMDFRYFDKEHELRLIDTSRGEDFEELVEKIAEEVYLEMSNARNFVKQELRLEIEGFSMSKVFKIRALIFLSSIPSQDQARVCSFLKTIGPKFEHEAIGILKIKDSKIQLMLLAGLVGNEGVLDEEREKLSLYNVHEKHELLNLLESYILEVAKTNSMQSNKLVFEVIKIKTNIIKVIVELDVGTAKSWLCLCQQKINDPMLLSLVTIVLGYCGPVEEKQKKLENEQIKKEKLREELKIDEKLRQKEWQKEESGQGQKGGGAIKATLEKIKSAIVNENNLQLNAIFQDLSNKMTKVEIKMLLNQIIDGKTLLGLAVESGNHAAFDLLLRHEADVNLVDDNLHTPLHCAILKGKTPMAEKLIYRGASVYINHELGKSLFDMAVMGKDWLLAKKICAIEVVDDCGEPYLYTAIIKGDVSVVCKLLEDGKNDDFKFNKAVLYLASMMQFLKLLPKEGVEKIKVDTGNVIDAIKLVTTAGQAIEISDMAKCYFEELCNEYSGIVG